MRAYSGDPIGYYNLVSTGVAVVQALGNPADARSFIGYVSGGDILYRVDGSVPNATGDQLIQSGSTFTLTGKPTILGFQWCAAATGSVTIFGTFYD
jgi:hypothetical protein